MRYLFNTAGEYVAFAGNGHLFTPDCSWLGVIVSGNRVYRPDGTFLGHLSQDDRVVRRSGETVARIARPLRPLQPIQPLPPIRRLRMPRLPPPYEDVFEASPQASKPALTQAVSATFEGLLGAVIVAGDGNSIGTVSKSHHDTNSIANPYGPYGSRYSATCIFNAYCVYGGQYGIWSPFNPYCAQPPKLSKNGMILGNLTVQQYIQNRVDPVALAAWLGIE